MWSSFCVCLLVAMAPPGVWGQDGSAPPMTCTGPAVAAVFVTLLVCLFLFAVIMFLLRRKGKAIHCSWDEWKLWQIFVAADDYSEICMRPNRSTFNFKNVED